MLRIFNGKVDDEAYVYLYMWSRIEADHIYVLCGNSDVCLLAGRSMGDKRESIGDWGKEWTFFVGSGVVLRRVHIGLSRHLSHQ